MAGATQDANGDTSSKRVVGMACGLSGAALKVSLGVASLFTRVADPATANAAADGLMAYGALYLAGTLVEWLRPKVGS